VTAFRNPTSRRPQGDGQDSGPVVVAPGGRHVALFAGASTGHERHTDHVFERATGKLVFSRARSSYFDDGIPAVFSPTGDRVLFPNGTQYRFKGTDPADVWDTATGKSVGKVGVLNIMSAASFSPGGTQLVVASPENTGDGMGHLTVTGWDTKTWKMSGEYLFPQGRGVAALAATNARSAVVVANGVVALDLPGGRVGETIDDVVHWPGQSVRYGPLALSPDGKKLAAGVPTTTPGVYAVRVYDWRQARPLHTFTGHTGHVTALAFSADGKLLASGSDDTTVVVWNVAGKE
jgi:WD40 repeat protein